MAQSQCIKIRMKPGTTKRFVEWAKTVHNRVDEVQTCLKEEGILAEHLFLERSPTGDHIIFYTKAKDLAEASQAFLKSGRKLDLEMKEMIETTWDRSSVTPLELVLDL